MEVVLEQGEIEDLLRIALWEARNITLPPDASMVIRQNHKKQTIRVVFRTQDVPAEKRR